MADTKRFLLPRREFTFWTLSSIIGASSIGALLPGCGMQSSVEELQEKGLKFSGVSLAAETDGTIDEEAVAKKFDFSDNNKVESLDPLLIELLNECYELTYPGKNLQGVMIDLWGKAEMEKAGARDGMFVLPNYVVIQSGAGAANFFYYLSHEVGHWRDNGLDREHRAVAVSLILGLAPYKFFPGIAEYQHKKVTIGKITVDPTDTYWVPYNNPFSISFYDILQSWGYSNNDSEHRYGKRAVLIGLAEGLSLAEIEKKFDKTHAKHLDLEVDKKMPKDRNGRFQLGSLAIQRLYENEIIPCPFITPERKDKIRDFFYGRLEGILNYAPDQ